MVHRLRPMHWRIASAYILLIVCTLALLSLVLLQLLRATYLQTLEDGLAGQARLVASIAGDRPMQRRRCLGGMCCPALHTDGLVEAGQLRELAASG